MEMNSTAARTNDISMHHREFVKGKPPLMIMGHKGGSRHAGGL
jgi:hypothetical protein